MIFDKPEIIEELFIEIWHGACFIKGMNQIKNKGEEKMGHSISDSSYKRIKSLQDRNLDCRGAQCYRRAKIQNIIRNENGETTKIRTCNVHVVLTDGVNFKILGYKPISRV